MITISSSWVFNRLCEEPERLRKQVAEQAEAIYEQNHDVFNLLDIFQGQYREYQERAKQVATMRLEQNPKIVISNDTPYIEVTVK